MIMTGLTVALAACGRGADATDARAVTVDVIGDDFNWYFKYAGADGQAGTPDDQTSVRHLYLPANTQITLNLHSKDYLYSFALPDFGQSSVAVPDLDYSVSFQTGDPGTYALRGDQFCGFSHETLLGEVRVGRPKDTAFAQLFAHD